MTLYSPADVTVAVLARPGETRVDRTLAALDGQTVAGFDVVVVDGPYRGEAASANAARGKTDRSLLLFLSGGAVPSPGTVEAHLAFHRAAPHARVVGAGLLAPSPGLSAAGRWLVETSAAVGLDLRHASVPTALLDTIGGFDEAFAFGLAGADLGYRALAVGASVEGVPNATVDVDGPRDWAGVSDALDPLAWAERQLAAKHPRHAPVVEARVESSRRTRKLAARFRAAWDAGRELDELRAYLGPEFEWNMLFRHSREVDHAHELVGDEATFFRTTSVYLYDLTVFALSRTKAPYLDELRTLVAPGAKILDYGCGIGSDGLQLLEAGYRVSFADFDNPSTRYLKWRLTHRRLDAPVYDVDGNVPAGFDVAYAFDVIEHVDDPFAFLSALEERADLVVVNLLESDPRDTHLHHELPIAELIGHARARGLLLNRKLHGRSHLIAYRSP